jgi:hypothetical protein
MAKFTGMLIYPIAPVLSEVGLEKVTGGNWYEDWLKSKGRGGTARTAALSV